MGTFSYHITKIPPTESSLSTCSRAGDLTCFHGVGAYTKLQKALSCLFVHLSLCLHGTTQLIEWILMKF